MLVKDIPIYFVQITATQWSDPVEKKMCFLDPTDALSLIARPWTPIELSNYNNNLALRTTNAAALSASALASIATLKTGIGVAIKLADGSANPALVIGPTSINGIIADTKANINANPANYINALVKFLKATDRALITLLKVTQGDISDATVSSD